ncbi:hypothetical protein [Microvirga mediterraneensis]|uniref:Uncharacterized protein n=1 Tax=Microvirga mediterraneensis TaxID=2754695 RepID=A0A838BUC3_9HYPH|nr:hypothetical protein [Microvirga mediterraneensis]MBA1159021.1 hypothetical protein [Microvirga mediterraneensis]
MSKVSYTWGSERPSQRRKRMDSARKSALAQMEDEKRRHKERMDALKARLEEIDSHMEAIDLVTAAGRIDRTLEEAKAEDLRALDEVEPRKRGRGRPRKVVPEASGTTPAKESTKASKTKAPAVQARHALSQPRNELSPPGTDQGLDLSPSVLPASSAAAMKAKSTREPKAKDPAVAALRAIDLSDVAAVPGALTKVFPQANFPLAYEYGVEDPDRVSYENLASEDKIRWITSVHFKGDQAAYDKAFKVNLSDNFRMQKLYKDDIPQAMAKESARRKLWATVRKRVQHVVKTYPDVLSGKVPLESVQKALSEYDQSDLSYMGVAEQRTWWEFVDALPWPEGLSRRDIMVFDGRGDMMDPDAFAFWDTTKTKKREGSVLREQVSAEKRAEQKARERMEELRRLSFLASSQQKAELEELEKHFAPPSSPDS